MQTLTNKGGITILIKIYKVEFRARNIIRDKKIGSESTEVLHLYAPNRRASKCIKQTRRELKGETEKPMFGHTILRLLALLFLTMCRGRVDNES